MNFWTKNEDFEQCVLAEKKMRHKLQAKNFRFLTFRLDQKFKMQGTKEEGF